MGSDALRERLGPGTPSEMSICVEALLTHTVRHVTAAVAAASPCMLGAVQVIMHDGRCAPGPTFAHAPPEVEGCGPARPVSELAGSADAPGDGTPLSGSHQRSGPRHVCALLQGCGPAHPASELAGSFGAPWVAALCSGLGFGGSCIRTLQVLHCAPHVCIPYPWLGRGRPCIHVCGCGPCSGGP